ncbi:MAG: hypothetical protein IT435_05310 [Phycisphaerales bacterium]|nr:hypothetical protein [Phycisphaerales bacterium]
MAMLLLVVGVVVVLPVGVAAMGVVKGLMEGGSGGGVGVIADLASWESLVSVAVVVRTIGWSLGIGVTATLLGWPAAWGIRKFGRSGIVWLVAPMCMPSYLAYAGYGLVRAPGTRIGDWLARAAHEGWPDAPVYAGKVLAFLGLSLWCWPVAGVVLGLAASRVDEGVMESLRVDGAGWWRRQRVLVGVMRCPIAVGVGVVGMLMLGSAIPTHLAQMDTWGIKLWFAIDNTGEGERWRIWMLSAPLLVVGGIGGWVIAVRAVGSWRMAGEGGEEAKRWREGETKWGRRGGVWSLVVSAVVLLAGTVAPLVLFAWSIREVTSLAVFWRVNADAASWSVLVAVMVGVVGAVVCVGCWVVGSAGMGGGRGRGVLRWVVMSLGIAGLAPGVIVGTMVNRAWIGGWGWEQTRWVGDSYWIVVLAHAARFCWVPAIMGCWVAGLEPVERRMQRMVDGGGGVRVWWWACAQGGIPVWVVGPIAGVITGLMSLHEIESTVMVSPPGVDSLARRILQFLHYARMEDLSAAGVWLIGGGLVVAGGVAVAGWLMGRRGGGVE